MATTEEKVRAVAERILELAKEGAALAGINPEIGKVQVLELALGCAWAEVILFGGADSEERVADATRISQERIAAELKLQHAERRGGKYLTLSDRLLLPRN